MNVAANEGIEGNSAELKKIGPQIATTRWSEALFRHFDNQRRRSLLAIDPLFQGVGAGPAYAATCRHFGDFLPKFLGIR